MSFGGTFCAGAREGGGTPSAALGVGEAASEQFDGLRSDLFALGALRGGQPAALYRMTWAYHQNPEEPHDRRTSEIKAKEPFNRSHKLNQR